MIKTIFPPQTIGIIGGGQLGKMLAQSAQKYGFRVHIYDPSANACAKGVSHQFTMGSFDDREKLLEFASEVDVLTYEFENINSDILKELSHKTHLPQGYEFLITTQNRIREKKWLNAIGLKTVSFVEVNSLKDLKQGLINLGYPAVLKTTSLGYDGKGQIVLKNEKQLETDAHIITSLLEQTCILEAFCDFKMEASVVVSRDQYGHIDCFESTKNLHYSGLLSASVTTNSISDQLQKKLKQMAEKIALKSSLVGVCGVEFFITHDEDLIVNELAPRPHNTGHYTIEGCNISQFDQHILAITGREIHTSKVLLPTMMINILGQHIPLMSRLMKEFPHALIHIYDKGEPRKQRKMGHFILCGETNNELENLIRNHDFLSEWFEMIQKA